MRAIGVIAQADTGGMMPAFSGGTSLSKGWELIKRFSEGAGSVRHTESGYFRR